VSYALSIEPKPGYLHIVVTGDNTRENVIRYMDEVVRECTLRQCFRVLVEERLDGPRLGTLDVFEMVATGSSRFLRTLKAMAYVDVNGERRSESRVSGEDLSDRHRRRALAGGRAAAQHLAGCRCSRGAAWQPGRSQTTPLASSRHTRSLMVHGAIRPRP
jgi:hypothetical protein